MENYPGPDDNAASALTVQNETPFIVKLCFKGPEDKMLGLDFGGSAQLILVKGNYSITAEAENPGVLPYNGEASFTDDDYNAEVLVDNQRKALFVALS